MRACPILSGIALLCGVAFCQSAEPRPAFEIADIHNSPQTRNPYMRGPYVRGGRYEIRTATMVDLVGAAYGVDADKVQGGPNWLENDLFDIIAKSPADSTPETRKVMLQTLLAERFKLVAHTDSRALPAWALRAGKHPLLKQSDGSGEPGCKFLPLAPQVPRQPGGPPPAPPVFSFECHNMTMEAFARQMRDNMPLPQQLYENPVLDQTELKGAWDFNIKYSVNFGRGAVAPSDTVSFFDAVDKQLGLKLESVKVPLSVVVVDSVNQKPTANVANVAEALHLPPLPTEFEVAEIKPSNPDFKGVRFQIQRGGRINFAGATLKFLIQQAWNLSDDMIVDAPKWLNDDRWDLIAKAPAIMSETGTPGNSDVDIDTVWVMVRSLLADRFKLATHFEDRPVPAYTLTATSKPKLKKADPASRTKFTEGPAPDSKDDPRNKNPALSRLVTCQNMTMAQFAEKLQFIASGYVHSPVLDATGLEGAWDFTLSFSPAGMLQNGGNGMRGGDAPQPSGDGLSASDPSGAISLPDAISKQLGLKLELQKRPVRVLVIDHVEPKPTEN